MGMGAKGSPAGIHLDGTKHWWTCPRCGEQNPNESTKCRDCLTPHSQAATTPTPKPTTLPEAVPQKPRKVANPMAWKAGQAITRDIVAPSVPKVVRRKVIRKKVAVPLKSASKLDLLRRAIDAFTRPREVEMFQCPACGRVVDESVAVCTCGAIFEDAKGRPWGYECPECGRRVASDSVQCRCGARFSD